MSQDKYNAPFPSNLRAILKEKGITITALSNALGISRQAVSQYADGTGQPNADKLTRIADFFGVSTDWLLGRSGGVKEVNADIIGAAQYTKLAESVINWLHCEDKENIEILNLLLSHYSFRRLIPDMAYLKETIKQVDQKREEEIIDMINADDPDALSEELTSQYGELEKQIGGLHLVDDIEYISMKEYFINKEISIIIEEILHCDESWCKNERNLLFDNGNLTEAFGAAPDDE